jgi:hypothetical protein
MRHQTGILGCSVRQYMSAANMPLARRWRSIPGGKAS